MLQQIIFWRFKVNTFSLDRPGRQRPWERGHTWGTSNLSYSPVIVAMLSHLGFQITYSGTEKSGGHHGHSHSAENMNMRGEFRCIPTLDRPEWLDLKDFKAPSNNVPSQEFFCMWWLMPLAVWLWSYLLSLCGFSQARSSSKYHRHPCQCYFQEEQEDGTFVDLPENQWTK